MTKPVSNWAVLDEDGNVMPVSSKWNLLIEDVIPRQWEVEEDIVNGYYVYVDFYGVWEDQKDPDYPKGWFDARVVSYDFGYPDVEAADTEHWCEQANTRAEALERFAQAKAFARTLPRGPH